MSQTATVSVVIPTCNASPFLQKCVESVVEQSHQPSQIIICDDASVDGTQEIIKGLKNRYPDLVETILHSENLGISANFNSGFSRASGMYISLIAGDDLWRKDKLRLELQALQTTPKARWAYSDSYIIDENGNYIDRFNREHDGCEGAILFQVLTHQMTLRNWIAERALIQEIGQFDERFQIFEDWDYKIRLAQAAHIAHVARENVAYRRHGNGISSSGGELFFRNLKRVHEKHRRIIVGQPLAKRKTIVAETMNELKINLQRWRGESESTLTGYQYFYYLVSIRLRSLAAII
jgi:glycosyltransferase involved in cell wall biosynthesis